MPKYHIRHVPLKAWFPENDVVATRFAQLCILRQDYFLELQGISCSSIRELDEASTALRRMYFWRNSLRTLQEIRVVLNKLDGESSFREGALRESEDVRAAFYEVKEEINKASKLILEDLRHEISGHLDEAAVAMAIRDLQPGSTGLLQVGDVLGKVHYKFAAELIMAVILRGASPENQLDKLDEILSLGGRLIKVLKVMDDLIWAYVKVRRLASI